MNAVFVNLWLLAMGTAVAAEPSRPCWIWCTTTAKEGQKAYFRKVLRVEGKIARAELRAIADQKLTVYVNGREALSASGYGRMQRADVTALLQPGDNVLAIAGTNDAGPAGVLASLRVELTGGELMRLVTDESWQAGEAASQGWQEAGFDARGWTAAFNLGRLGVAPWGDPTGQVDDYNQWKQALEPGSATDPATIVAPKGFQIELLRSAQRGEGSWISLAFDGRGRMLVGREDRGILRMTLDADARRATSVSKVETVDDTLLECRGLLWAYDSLYANANNSKGFYRLQDTDGDDRYDSVKLLKATAGDVGHGRNDLALGTDGMIYLVHGNDVRVPDELLPPRLAASPSPLQTIGEDRLLPCRWDEHLMNAGTRAPAGFVARTDRDGTRWELIAAGFRNPYGIDFNADGELFTYDADMEWDEGAPWYRPTRVNHVVSGGEYGWRQGTGKWPAWLPDSLPSNGDVGKGSPTGIKFGTRSNFPPPYRRALFILDWAYGRILAVHLTERGASYTGRMETFVKGRPLNVTDLDFGPDGAMYFVIGGRGTQSGLYRVRYVGPKVDEPQAAPDDEATRSRARRRELEAFHARQDRQALEPAWRDLDSGDAWLRYAARIALERQPVAWWRDRALSESRPTAALTALLALARVGPRDVKEPLLARLAHFEFRALSQDQRLVVLRTYSLTFIRQGRPDAQAARSIAARLGAICGIL